MPPLPRSLWPLLIIAGVQCGLAIQFLLAPFRGGEWPPSWLHVAFFALGLALLAFGIRNVRRLRVARVSPR